MVRNIVSPKNVLAVILLLSLFPLHLPAKTDGSSSKWEMVGLISFTSVARQSPTTIVATTTHGYLYFSTDNGSTWSRRELDDTLALTDIAFVDSLHGVVTDQTHNILLTSDGGHTWTYTKLPLDTTRITSAAYPATNTILVCDTAGNIWRTTDGAKTGWKSQLHSDYTYFTKVFFPTAQNGFALGNLGTFFITTDGGDHWTFNDITGGNPINTNGSPIDLLSMDFYSDTRAIIGATGSYFTTTDGGSHWKIHAMPGSMMGPLNVVKLVSASEFFALGFSGQVYHSANFGDTIGVALLGHIGDYGVVHGAVFDQANNCIAVGDMSLIMKSSDGKEWTPINQCLSRGPIEAIGNNILHCFGDIPVSSSDGGVFWNGSEYQTELGFIGIHFTSKDSGFVVNSDNYDWLRTTDNGKSWAVPTYANLKSLPIPPYAKGGYTASSFNGMTGYAAGDTIILRTADNGNSLAVSSLSYDRSTPFAGQSKPVYWNISQVQAIDDLYGVAALFIRDSIFHPANGQSLSGNIHSQVFRTTDGGNSWAPLPNAPTVYIRNMWFTSRQTGYLACDSAIVFKTTDGGNTWKRDQISTAQNNFIYGLKFLNDTVGFLSLRYNGLLSTTDGGSTWTKEIVRHPAAYPDPITFSDFLFPDAHSVLAIATGISGAGFFRKTFTLKAAVATGDQQGNKETEIRIRLYPNPASEILHCTLEGIEDYHASNFSAGIYNVLGREVLDIGDAIRSASSGSQKEVILETGKLPAGSYTLRCTDGERSGITKVMVIR